MSRNRLRKQSAYDSPRSYLEEEGVVAVLGVLVDELTGVAAGVDAGAGDAALGVAEAADSFFSPFSPVLVPPVSPAVLDGGLSLSE